jgi:methionyl-tRNA formyltransferase
MKVVFFGTPEFALPALQALRAGPHEVIGVVTAPDKPRGRNLTPTPTPIAQAAADLGLPVLKPEGLRDSSFLTELQAWKGDGFAVVAFRILPEEVFSLPLYGAINLHGSLLPAYRGAAPIQWALWNGEANTGLTTFRIERAVDTGNILKQLRVEILTDDDAGSLSRRMASEGANLLVKTLTELEQGTLLPQPQDNTNATPAPKIAKEHCLIDWNRSADAVRNQIRALSPEPAAYTTFERLLLKIFRTEVVENPLSLEPGELLIDDQRLVVGTAREALRIQELQLQGKKRIEAGAFLRGFRLRGRYQFTTL